MKQGPGRRYVPALGIAAEIPASCSIAFDYAAGFSCYRPNSPTGCPRSVRYRMTISGQQRIIRGRVTDKCRLRVKTRHPPKSPLESANSQERTFRNLLGFHFPPSPNSIPAGLEWT
jgi:hypothetical protein